MGTYACNCKVVPPELKISPNILDYGDINYGNPRNNTWIPCNFNFITYIEIIVSSHTCCGVQWRQFFSIFAHVRACI